jgi:hypothetical protein
MMKKRYIAEIIIILAASGFVFFTGWTQFKVPGGNCGILISKTGGVNSEPVLPGRFSWHWEYLLPTNAELRLFKLEPYTAAKTVQGTLPSADIYGTVYETPPDFSYSVGFSISAKIDPADIAELVKDSVITDSASLTAYLESAYSTLANKAAAYILDRASNAASFHAESLQTGDILAGIDALRDYPYIIFTDFSIVSSKLPDFTLYNNARSTYIENQKKLQERAVERKQKVSELLQQFPELQDIFSGK